MRGRRARKLTQEQLAEEIKVPVVDIREAEKGVMPENSYTLALKLQEALGIKILSPEMSKKLSEAVSLKLQGISTDGLNIQDLDELKEERQKEIELRDEGEILEAEERFAKKEPKKKKWWSFILGNEEEEDVDEEIIEKDIENSKNPNYEDLSDEEIDELIFKGKY